MTPQKRSKLKIKDPGDRGKLPWILTIVVIIGVVLLQWFVLSNYSPWFGSDKDTVTTAASPAAVSPSAASTLTAEKGDERPAPVVRKTGITPVTGPSGSPTAPVALPKQPKSAETPGTTAASASDHPADGKGVVKEAVPASKLKKDPEILKAPIKKPKNVAPTPEPQPEPTKFEFKAPVKKAVASDTLVAKPKELPKNKAPKPLPVPEPTKFVKEDPSKAPKPKDARVMTPVKIKGKTPPPSPQPEPKKFVKTTPTKIPIKSPPPPKPVPKPKKFKKTDPTKRSQPKDIAIINPKTIKKKPVLPKPSLQPKPEKHTIQPPVPKTVPRDSLVYRQPASRVIVTPDIDRENRQVMNSVTRLAFLKGLRYMTTEGKFHLPIEKEKRVLFLLSLSKTENDNTDFDRSISSLLNEKDTTLLRGRKSSAVTHSRLFDSVKGALVVLTGQIKSDFRFETGSRLLDADRIELAGRLINLCGALRDGSIKLSNSQAKEMIPVIEYYYLRSTSVDQAKFEFFRSLNREQLELFQANADEWKKEDGKIPRGHKALRYESAYIRDIINILSEKVGNTNV